MPSWTRLLVIGFIVCGIGCPADSDAQPSSLEKTRIGGSYDYLRFPNAVPAMSLYSINVVYNNNRQWAMNWGIGIARGNLNLDNRVVILPNGENKSTLIPFRMGVTRHLYLPESMRPEGENTNYRFYITGGVSLLPVIEQSQSVNTQTKTRYGMLAGPYGAVGFEFFARDPIPFSINISPLEMYYHTAFSSRFNPMEGVTYGSSIMLSISFIQSQR